MALAGRCNSAPVPEQPAVRAPPGMRSERLGRPAASRCGVSCALLGSHSPQIAPRDHRKLWFWAAVAGPSQARRPRLGPHASPYAWASAGRGKACSLLYINALRYTPQNHPSTGGARFGSQSSRSYLHRVLARLTRPPPLTGRPLNPQSGVLQGATRCSRRRSRQVKLPPRRSIPCLARVEPARRLGSSRRPRRRQTLY